MSEHLPDTRRYGDREIAKILKRAAAMQRRTPARPDPSGLTLAELEEIAVEAGIDPENLRLAAAEVSSGSDDSLETKLLGAPLSLRLERSMAGELPPRLFGNLVPLLQAESGMTGQASTVGNTLTWASTATGNHVRSLNVLVISEAGQTRIQLEERSTQAAVGFHVGFSSGGLGFAVPAGLGIGATVGVAAGLGVGLGIGGLFYWIGRTFYRVTTERRRRKLEALFDKLAERIESLIAHEALESGEEPGRLMSGDPGGRAGQ